MRLAIAQRRQAADLHEVRRAGGVVFDQLADLRGRAPSGVTNQPSRQPVISQVLEKLFAPMSAVVLVGESEEGRRGPCPPIVEGALVDVVGEQPDTEAAAVVENRRAAGRRPTSSRSELPGELMKDEPRLGRDRRDVIRRGRAASALPRARKPTRTTSAPKDAGSRSGSARPGSRRRPGVPRIGAPPAWRSSARTPRRW